MPNITPAVILNGFGVTEPTPGDTIDPVWLPAASVAWGAITGLLSNQSDLNTALAGKAATSHAHAWADITSGKPTTLAGYGITDAATSAQGTLAGTALQPAGNGSALTGLTKSQVGLSNVDNTADSAKPVSTLQATAIALKSDLRIVSFPTPTTGQTQTFTTTKADHMIACNHIATIAAQTFVFPTDVNSVIGQELRIFSRSIITVVTFTLNGNTVIGLALTTLPVNGSAAWMKTAASNWVRIQ